MRKKTRSVYPHQNPKSTLSFFLVSIDAWMNLIRLDLAIWSNQWIVSDQIVSFNYLVTRYMPIIVIVVTGYDLFCSVLCHLTVYILYRNKTPVRPVLHVYSYSINGIRNILVFFFFARLFKFSIGSSMSRSPKKIYQSVINFFSPIEGYVF